MRRFGMWLTLLCIVLILAAGYTARGKVLARGDPRVPAQLARLGTLTQIVAFNTPRAQVLLADGRWLTLDADAPGASVVSWLRPQTVVLLAGGFLVNASGEAVHVTGQTNAPAGRVQHQR